MLTDLAKQNDQEPYLEALLNEDVNAFQDIINYLKSSYILALEGNLSIFEEVVLRFSEEERKYLKEHLPMVELKRFFVLKILTDLKQKAFSKELIKKWATFFRENLITGVEKDEDTKYVLAKLQDLNTNEGIDEMIALMSLPDESPIILEVLKEIPEFSIDWEEYLKVGEYSIGNTPGPTCDFGALGHFTVKKLQEENQNTILIKRIFDLIEKFIVEGNDLVQTAATTGFLEAIDHSIPDCIQVSDFKSYLGRESLAYLREYDKFMGKGDMYE